MAVAPTPVALGVPFCYMTQSPGRVRAMICVGKGNVSLVEASDAVPASVTLPICVRVRSAFQVLPDFEARAVTPSHMG